MAVPTRPYFIILNDKEHMVEASTQAAAIQHLIGGQVSELRPARATEVLAWHRAGKPVQTAGVKAPNATVTDPVGEPLRDAFLDKINDQSALQTGDGAMVVAATENAGGVADEVLQHIDPQSIIDSTVKFDGGDAAHWFEQQVGFTKTARATWDAIVTSGRMTLEQFDTMRKSLGAFSSALSFDRTNPGGPVAVDGLRSRLETEPMAIEAIIERIGEAVARERANEGVIATHD
jgi:hypothetical protein